MAEAFTEIKAILVHHARGLGFAALVVVGGVIEAAVEADVERPIALGAFVAKTDAVLRNTF